MSRSHFFEVIECYLDCQHPADVHAFLAVDFDVYLRVIVERLERNSRAKVGGRVGA